MVASGWANLQDPGLEGSRVPKKAGQGLLGLDKGLSGSVLALLGAALSQDKKGSSHEGVARL